MSCDYEGFPLGVHSYSFRRTLALDALIKDVRSVGLGYIEIHPLHVPLESAQIEVKESLVRLKNAGIDATAYGCVPLGHDEGHDRRVLSFCRNGGIVSLCADPDPESLPIVDGLAAEYGIRVAIVNKWEDEQWGRLGSIVESIRDASPFLGICLDTGSALCAGEDPAVAIEAMPQRIFGVHLRDATFMAERRWREVHLGQGHLDLAAILKKLLRSGFTGFLSLAYEAEAEDPVVPILESFTGFLAAARAVRGARR